MKEKELSNSITIRDPFLEPFYIQKDTYGYTVLEDATPDQRYTESVKKIQKTIILPKEALFSCNLYATRYIFYEATF